MRKKKKKKVQFSYKYFYFYLDLNKDQKDGEKKNCWYVQISKLVITSCEKTKKNKVMK